MTEKIKLSDRVIRGIDSTILAVASVALVLMMLHITVDVLCSLLLNEPIAVTSAFVIKYYMIAVAFLPLASGEFRGAHISVDLFVNHLPAAPRRWLNWVVLALCVALYALLAIQAWQLAMEKLAVKAFILEQTTQLIIWPSFFIVPVGFGLIALLLALKLWCLLIGKPEPEPLALTDEENLLKGYGDV